MKNKSKSRPVTWGTVSTSCRDPEGFVLGGPPQTTDFCGGGSSFLFNDGPALTAGLVAL